MNDKEYPYFRIPEALKSEYRPWDSRDFKGWIAIPLLDRLGPDQKSEPETLLHLPGAKVMRDRRNLTVRLGLDGQAVWVKRFRPAGALDRAMYAARPGKAVYAWNAAMALMEQGFHTPRPLLGLRRTGRLGGAEGIVAFEDVGDHPPLQRLLSGDALGPAARMQLRYELGNCLRRFHDLGFRHRDLRQGNILAVRSDGSWSMWFLDLNRLRVQKPLTEIQRLREVERLGLPAGELESFFDAYMPERNNAAVARTYQNRVDYANRLGDLPFGKLLRKAWYYSWELRTFSRARRP